MKNSKKFFKHIYVEEAIINDNITREIISKIKDPVIITIKNYLEIFGRKKQEFILQKQNPFLILAEKWHNFIYPNPPYCQNFGYKNSYYTSIILNCLFDCKYCFLQGMYDSAHIVIFVNIEDYFNEIKKLKLPAMLFLSYDTDLLAFEFLTGYIHRIYSFLKNHRGITVEIRTKSSNFKAIEDLSPLQNIILAWSILPDELIKDFEVNTPLLKERLNAIRKAIDRGWNVRLCIDPVIFTKESFEFYEKMIIDISKNLEINEIFDVSVGNFRMNENYLKKLLSIRPEITEFQNKNKELFGKFVEKISSILVDKKIYSLYN